MRRALYFICLFFMLTTGLYGCGNSTSATTAPTAKARSAKAIFNVTIPQKVVKSLIPNATSYVVVNWYGLDINGYNELRLTPDATGKATGSVDLLPGAYYFEATCFDANGYSISTATSYANVGTGDNNIVISFISGRWTFASPVVLSQGETLSSVDVEPSLSQYEGTYPATWNVAGSTGTPLALSGTLDFISLSGDLSSLAGWIGVPSNTAGGQFDLISMTYDITTPSNSNGNWIEGDRVILATSMGPADGGGSSSPDISAYFNTKLSSGTTMTGTLLEFTAGTSSSVPVANPTGICDTQSPMYKKTTQRTAALNAAIASRAAKASGTPVATTVTLTYPSCDYVSSGGEPFIDVNGNGEYDTDEFYDMNGNGKYDEGIDYPFYDFNGNGVYDLAEPFTDSNNNGVYDYGTGTYSEVTYTETIKNLIAYPFTATATELIQVMAKPVVRKR